MKNSSIVRIAAVAGAFGLVLAGATACSGSGGAGQSGDGKLTLTVGNEPPADQKEQRAAFLKQVADFEKQNPDIKIEPSDWTYDGQQFQTQLAGGTLPIVLSAPLTEPPALIANKQAADITDAAKSAGLLDELNPDLVNLVSDGGRVYGVPTWAYALGIAYNRDLFKAAGLDPDAGPASWDDVRSDAKVIKEKTGQAGYAQLAAKNCGGWLLTAMTYSFGGRVVDDSNKKAIFADEPEMGEALQLIHDMKWVDGTLPEQTLYDCENIQPDFAAGKIGMTLKADFIPATQQYGMSPDAFGYAGIPAASDGKHSTLSGGGIAFISPKASEAEIEAGLKYIKFMNLQKYFDEDLAVANAKAAKADNAVYEQPGLAPVSSEQYDTFLGWIEPYSIIPFSNWAPYRESLPGTTLVPEPKYQGQAIYAELDNVIQAVLTDQNADIAKLLKDAQERANALLAAS